MSDPCRFFVHWREDFDDQYGWFTHAGVSQIVDRLIGYGWNPTTHDEGVGEACVYSIIEGVDAKRQFLNQNLEK